MVKVRIYPACIRCDCPKYQVDRPSQTICTFGDDDYIKTDNIMACEHERVCKLIDGQEPIELGESCK